jgi:uncharacterized protein (TIGR03663 family)
LKFTDCLDRGGLWLLAALAAAGALTLALTAATNRPMHTDEAVNAVALGDMLRGEPLRYDPQDRHGPTLLLLARPIVRVCGVDSLARMEVWHVRVVAAGCGAVLILVLPLLARALGAGAVAAALPWFVLGAPFVAFGGTFIHEMLYALLTLLLIAAGWAWVTRPTIGRAAMIGAIAGLMLATKEVAPVTFALVGLAAVGSRATPRLLRSTDSVVARSGRSGTEASDITTSSCSPKQGHKRTAAVALVIALITAAILLSSFGAHPSGPLDLGRGWVRFLARAGGEGHEKPWFTYTEWLLAPNLRAWTWFGWSVLGFAIAGSVAAFRARNERPLAWFLVWFTGLTSVVFSLTPYKTPWVMLGFLVPAVLIAGMGFASAVARWDARARPFVATAGVLAVAFLLGVETRQLCFRFPVDPANPLAYSPSVEDVERVPALIERRLAGRTSREPPLVQVVGDDYWPLPWYLRRLERVGYWAELPQDAAAGDVVVATGGAIESTTQRLGSDWRADPVGLRPEVLAVVFTRRNP